MLFENWPEFCMVEIRWAIVITDLPFMTRSNASWTWNSLALSRALKQKKNLTICILKRYYACEKSYYIILASYNALLQFFDVSMKQKNQRMDFLSKKINKTYSDNQKVSRLKNLSCFLDCSSRKQGLYDRVPN